MFWKYVFPIILCLLLAWFIRKFLCIGINERRVPRLFIIILCILGFMPVLNYALFILIVVTLLIFPDAIDITFREKPFKNEKLQKWLIDT